MTFFSAAKLILTLHCDESSHLLSDAQDRELTRVERAALSFHLMLCRNCCRFRRQLEFMRKALRRLAGHDEPGEMSTTATLSPEARDRIREAVRRRVEEDE
ncbi:MAG: zf-HC2 domain-containing protein [Pirellulales bacterium]|nr:zf-HC2 domain-containing protein [Pirellulales bacterium]